MAAIGCVALLAAAVQAIEQLMMLAVTCMTSEHPLVVPMLDAQHQLHGSASSTKSHCSMAPDR